MGGGQVTRREDWPEQLAATIAAARHRPFEWGTHDCVLFAADGVQAMTGVEHADGVRGTYADALGAMRVLKSLGGPAVLVTTKLGYPIPVGLAQRGDVLLAVVEDRESLGLCEGAIGWFAGLDGLVPFPTLQCKTAWRV